VESYLPDLQLSISFIFLWLNNIPLYGYTTIYWSAHQPDKYFFPNFRLLWIAINTCT
jgi:hypothetical protein